MKNLVIAGGGLVGSLAAILMKKRGYNVLVLEKRPDIRKLQNDGGRSINLVVTSRGLNALEKAGLLKQTLNLTVPVTGRMIHSKTGETNYQAYGRDPVFFDFYRSMQAYREALQPNGTTMVLAPDAEFFRFFRSMLGETPAQGAIPAAPAPARAPTAAPAR